MIMQYFKPEVISGASPQEMAECDCPGGLGCEEHGCRALRGSFDPDLGYDPADPWDLETPGWYRFVVLTNAFYTAPNGRTAHTFEVEELDHGGAAQWADEMMGLDYWLQYHVDTTELVVGGVYEVRDMQVRFTHGDGYVTDDDEDWEFSGPTRIFAPWSRVKHVVIDFVYALRWWARRGRK